MSIKLGIIADDFTGATDIAGFLVAGGFRTAQINGIPQGPLPDVDAVVVSLKSRSIPASEAVRLSLDALAKLQEAGAEQIFFKYCSTFDSTADGNIGPVTDALLDSLGSDVTVLVPALPVNGRTVYNGHLFVNGVPLDESGMRNHPVNPMRDSSLVRLMEMQSVGRAGVVAFPTIEQGARAVRDEIVKLGAQGVRYVVLDALTDEHLDVIGEAVSELPLVTGGSGLGGALARAHSHGGPNAADTWTHVDGPTIVLSGSSSDMTNAQVNAYRALAPSRAVDVDHLMADPDGERQQILEWVLAQCGDLAPLVYATASPQEVQSYQARFGGAEVSSAIEQTFGWLARELAGQGFTRFIVAGGETSGAVTTALDVDGFEVGPQIAPGVPWVKSLDGRLELALKSGNFGDPDFFATAQTN